MINWLSVAVYILGYLLIGFIIATFMPGLYGEGWLTHEQMGLLIALWPIILVFVIIYIIFSTLAGLSEKLGSEVWRRRRNKKE